jgi:hypothetical protein
MIPVVVVELYEVYEAVPRVVEERRRVTCKLLASMSDVT